MSTKNRIASIAICAVLAIGVLPVAGHASGQENEASLQGCAPVVSESTSTWSTLDGAIAVVAYSPGVPQATAVRARAALDGARPGLEASIGLTAGGAELSVCLVTDRKIVAAALGMHGDPRMAGAALTGAGVAVVAVDVADELEWLVIHEAAHLLAAERARRSGERPLPGWLSEGLAELAAAEALGDFEELHFAAGELRRVGQLPTLRELQADQPDSRDLGRFSVASASLTAVLVETRGWGRVWAMLSITGKLPAQLEQEWHARL